MTPKPGDLVRIVPFLDDVPVTKTLLTSNPGAIHNEHNPVTAYVSSESVGIIIAVTDGIIEHAVGIEALLIFPEGMGWQGIVTLEILSRP